MDFCWTRSSNFIVTILTIYRHYKKHKTETAHGKQQIKRKFCFVWEHRVLSTWKTFQNSRDPFYGLRNIKYSLVCNIKRTLKILSLRLRDWYHLLTSHGCGKNNILRRREKQRRASSKWLKFSSSHTPASSKHTHISRVHTCIFRLLSMHLSCAACLQVLHWAPWALAEKGKRKAGGISKGKNNNNWCSNYLSFAFVNFISRKPNIIYFFRAFFIHMRIFYKIF